MESTKNRPQSSKNKKRSREHISDASPTVSTSLDAPNLDEHTKKILKVRELMDERRIAREKEDFLTSDTIRQKLVDMGVFVQDQKGGPSGWRFVDGSSKSIPSNVNIPTASSSPKTVLKDTSKSEIKVAKSIEQDRNKEILSKLKVDKASIKKENNKSNTQPTSNIREVQGVQITDVKIGSGQPAAVGQKVKVQYVGRLKSNNRVFDSSKKPFQFLLGRGQVIRGWDIGVVGMKPGGVRNLVIPPEKAYGRGGSPPVIPGNATLVFDVTMIDAK